jgi:hypothetical protein
MLTTEQIAVVKADIAANADLNTNPAGSDGSWAIAGLYNKTATPAYFVWRTNVPVDEVMRNGMDWTRVDNLSIGKARIWDWMTKLGSFNASKTNIRAGIDATWVGTAADLAVRDAVYTHCNRAATRLEKLLAAGVGTAASPATMAYEGTVSYQDIDAVRAA